MAIVVDVALGCSMQSWQRPNDRLYYVADHADILEPSGDDGISTYVGDPRSIQLVAQVFGEHEALGIKSRLVSVASTCTKRC